MVDAIAAGNRVMVKPSEYTPAFSSLLARLAGEAFPPTHVAVVQGGPEIAAAFSALPFDHLLFTGSTATGRKVAMAAAANLTPVTLELGGKSPAIVCPDAPDYVLIDEARADAFVDVMVDRVRRSYRTVANNPDYTSMISERHQSRLLAAIGEAEAAGARVVRVHGSETASGRAIGPVLVRGAPADGLLMSEEIFGPVLPIVTYRDLGQAMAQINARDRPLALYAFTRSQGSLERVLGGTISGGVTVNGTILHIAQDDLPFGGVGPSGIGAYHGFDGFKRFSHARSVFEIGFMNGFEMLAPPYGQLAKRAANVLIGRGKRVRRD
jgi:coniferyl-aldehyde dehydrogenase